MKLKAYAGRTDQGPYLEVNEDFFDVDLAQNLFMLIDAFGGAGQGDICGEKIITHIKESYAVVSGDPDSTLAFFYAPQYLLEGNALANAVLSCHQVICQDNGQRKIVQKAGASGVFLSFAQNMVNVLSVGNCRVYHLSLGKMTKINQEDSLDFINPRTRESVKVPLNAFGLYDYLHFGLKELKVMPGDYLVLLTDGAYNPLARSEIKSIIEQNARQSLDHALLEIFALANKRNNLDNQGGLILSF